MVVGIGCICYPAVAEEVKKSEPTQQFVMVQPAELENLKKLAKAGLDARSRETLRHMYTAAALHGILANSNHQIGDVTADVALAKSYGYAMMVAQGKDEKKREERAK